MTEIKNFDANLRPWPNVLSATDARLHEILIEKEKQLESQRLEINKIREQAVKEGFKEGFNRGKELQINEFSVKINEFFSNLNSQIMEELPSLTSEVIGKITGYYIHTDQAAILSIIKKMSEKFTMGRIVNIKINPSHEKSLDLENLKIFFPQGYNIEYIDEIEETTVFMEVSGQMIEFSMDSLMEQIKERMN